MKGQPWTRKSEFRFYEELNDFLPPEKRKRAFNYHFNGSPAIKDVIEAIGVPHVEVDLLLVDGESVGFDHQLTGGERVAVYPEFERLDISPLNRLRLRPLRVPRFVLDVHLGTLARYLRMLGIDALYRNDYADTEIVRIASDEKRAILTRDRGLLKRAEVTRGYWLRQMQPREQLREVVRVFDLDRQIRPFSRCMTCNGELEEVDKTLVIDELPRHVQATVSRFAKCLSCGKIYWAGSHFQRMRRFIELLGLSQT